MRRVLVTGCAGFIAFHVIQRLLQEGYGVLGVDNLNSFYDEGLKGARLGILRKLRGFQFIEAEIADLPSIQRIFIEQEFDPIIHLAAQAGVRYSLENPHLYIRSNIVGFVNLIEETRKKGASHFVFASSSSVYGANRKVPFTETDNVDCPVSLYAATKKSDELIAHVYAHLYDLPVTGLRFFTVYGPWGRPDMALFKFCKAILEGREIEVYNRGQMLRDFTYIDDIVEGVFRTLESPPQLASCELKTGQFNQAPFEIYNIGNNQPVEITRLIEILETKIDQKAIVRWLPMQPGDVPVTYADIDKLSARVGYRPSTSVETGIGRFVDWYREYYKL